MCDAFIKAAYDGVATLTARVAALEAQLIELGVLPARVDNLEVLIHLVDARAREALVAEPEPVPEPVPEPEPVAEPEPEPAPVVETPVVEVAPVRRHPLAGTIAIGTVRG